ncbi:MAG: hypothetical protein K6D97_05820 [Clostridia bacterium]|nr:hypothetical protein [Clostridia bacterium]
MYFLIFLPIIILAVILKLIFDRAKVKSLGFILKIVIIASSVLFAYFLLDYYGYNVFDMAREFVMNKFLG